MAFKIRLPDGSETTVATMDGHDDCTVLDANVPLVSLEALQQIKRTAVDALLAEKFAAGFTPVSGGLAGHTLQVRGIEDRTNWLTSQASYLAAVSNGMGADMGADFRTETNDTVTVSYAEGLQALLDMAAWGKTLFGKSWKVKDKINALTDPAAIEALDINAEWDAA